MSKAFTKEQDDDLDDDKDVESTAPQLPHGTKNYITPAGAEKLRAELKDLLYTKRPEITATVAWAASNGDRSENADYIYGKRRLREIDRRIRFLTKRLEIAEIVDPTQQSSDKVHFGATVTIQGEDGELKTYSIVGIDETEIHKKRISWISPLGRALLNAKVGDTIVLHSPKGEEDFEVMEIKYVALD